MLRQTISDRNKFIMDISDEELAAYIKNSQRSRSSVGKRDMTGQWERIMDGTDVIYYEFLENDSFRRKRVGRYPYIHLVKTAAGSTPSWMLSVFVVSMQFNYWIFQFIELIGFNIFLIQK